MGSTRLGSPDDDHRRGIIHGISSPTRRLDGCYPLTVLTQDTFLKDQPLHSLTATKRQHSGCPQERTTKESSSPAYVSRSFLILSCSSPRMVAISPCMKAHGTEDPARGHFSPLGQYTSLPLAAPWDLMLSLEQGKQNLWLGTDGHWTKWVSSSRSLQSVHLRGGAVAEPSPPLLPPLEVVVVVGVVSDSVEEVGRLEADFLPGRE